MNKIILAVMLGVSFLSGRVSAQDADAPEAAAEKPAMEQAAPAKAEPAKPPVSAPVAPVVEKVEKEVVVEKAPAKEMTACAKQFSPLSDGYKKAYDEMQAWIMKVNEQTAAAEGKLAALQEKVEKNEAMITKLKIEDSKDSRMKVKDLTRDNKVIWNELAAARKEKAALCKGFLQTAIQMSKQNATEMSQRLNEIKLQMK